jgi:membrane fusion protein (multidrug efflux system)
MTPGEEKPPIPGGDPPDAAETAPPAAAETQPAQSPPRAEAGGRHGWRRWAPWGAGGAVAVLALVFGGPCAYRAFTTVSTDDAYVSGHVTFVAPRVAGQVARVLVDDDNRVRKGDVLVELDKEPYQVKVGIAEAALGAAQADLVAAQAETRGLEGEARSLRFSLQKAMEAVNDQVALLRAKVAVLSSRKATLARAQADFDREVPLLKSGVVSKQQYDAYQEKLRVAEAQVAEAEEGVRQVRVGLGLPPVPARGEDLAAVPPDLDQTFSAVKQAQGKLIQVAAQLGMVGSYERSPEQMLADFYKRDPHGDINRIFDQLARDAPAVKQSEAKLAEAKRNLDQAELDLRYCDIVAEIDGVVTRRSVNPGNYVVVGQALMAVRSLTDIWVDANFKETQLSALRIGQKVDLDVDMYGRRQHFGGRISGFTMGTGSTLALLPPENATGNFVKVVQRLPVRIDLIDYDPDKTPLFVGLSVTPHVLVHEPPAGPDAGRVLQPYVMASGTPTNSSSAVTSGR